MNGPAWAVALIAIPSVCFLIDILSLGAQIIFILPATAVYGSASLLDVKNWRDDILRIVAAVLLVIVAWVLGIIEYFHGLIGYSAYNFFSDEFVRFRFDSGNASTFWFSELGGLTIVFGLMGAAWSFWFETGRARIFAATHIVATCIFIPVAYEIVHFANNYNGTMPARFEMSMWPYALVFSSIAIVQAVKSALQISRPFLKGRLQSLPRYGTPIALAASLAVIVAYNAGQALAHPGRQCPQSFSPIQATPITDVLRDNIAVRPGATFKGIVATIDGVKDKPSVSWLDLHFHDYQVWQRTGNDHQLVGLWHFRIPTLFQYFAFTTPPYYLLLTEFLSRPEDKQFRSGLVLTGVDEKMMRLWGVRYVITDGDSPVGRRIVDVPAAELGSLRLTELSDVNLGNYSPTEVRRVADFRSGISALHEPDFDGKRIVVTEADLRGSAEHRQQCPSDLHEIRLSVAGREPGPLRPCSSGSIQPLLVRARGWRCPAFSRRHDAARRGFHWDGRFKTRVQIRAVTGRRLSRRRSSRYGHVAGWRRPGHAANLPRRVTPGGESPRCNQASSRLLSRARRANGDPSARRRVCAPIISPIRRREAELPLRSASSPC